MRQTGRWVSEFRRYRSASPLGQSMISAHAVGQPESSQVEQHSRPGILWTSLTITGMAHSFCWTSLKFGKPRTLTCLSETLYITSFKITELK